MNLHNFIIGPTDTDSISFCKHDMSIMSLEEQKSLLKELNDLSPDFMIWSDDGYYDQCITLKAKNYILVKDGKTIIKGSAFKDTKKELALKDMLKEYIDSLISYGINYDKLVPIFHKYTKEANNIHDINRWTVKKTVTKKVLTGERTNETKVMDALKGQTLQEGDKVWVYAAIDGMTQAYAKGEPVTFKDRSPKMIPNCVLKIPAVWTKDEDKLHYVERVYKTTEILSNLLDMSHFTKFHLVKNRDLLTKL